MNKLRLVILISLVVVNISLILDRQRIQNAFDELLQADSDLKTSDVRLKTADDEIQKTVAQAFKAVDNTKAEMAQVVEYATYWHSNYFRLLANSTH